MNPKKLDLHKKHLDNIINEQSAIQETEANNDNTLNADDDDEYADNGNAAAATAAAVASSKKEERLKDEDYKCKIIYFYKNCSKVNILFLMETFLILLSTAILLFLKSERVFEKVSDR